MNRNPLIAVAWALMSMLVIGIHFGCEPVYDDRDECAATWVTTVGGYEYIRRWLLPERSRLGSPRSCVP